MLSPNFKPYKTGYLPAKNGHRIYFAEYGNPSRIPIVVCHGGPGSKSKPKHLNPYDLHLQHLIIFDQRGCGNSLPLGEINFNTTLDLINDMERLRTILKLEQWLVAGSSWGSTLALAYAEIHPERVLGLLLSSIFLGRRQDVDWSFTAAGGIDKIFPDLWQDRNHFLARHGANYQNAARVLLDKITTSPPPIIAELVAGVMNWEGNLMSAQSDLSFTDPQAVTEEDIASVKIFLHYDSHDSFLSENQLLKNINKIENIPAILVHGRYDLLCPLDQAWELHHHLKHSQLVVLPTSNHRLTADGEVARKLSFQYFLTKYFK